MTIFDKTGHRSSYAQGTQALDLFTDRNELIKLFLDYLHACPHREKILYFYGEGGIGKSILLRYLHRYCCKVLHPDNLKWIYENRFSLLHQEIRNAQGAVPIHSVFLDFAPSPSIADDHTRPFEAMTAIRRALAKTRLRLPLFDYASIWYLHATSQLNEARIQSLFPAEEVDFLSAMMDAITHNPYGKLTKAILGIFNKHLKRKFSFYQFERRLDEEQVDAIQRMEPRHELLMELPSLFAQDLSIALKGKGSIRQLALFFDSHEAFWGISKRWASADTFHYQDEWLRRLLGSLDLSGGVTAVVSGRDFPQWSTAPRYQIPNEYVDAHEILPWSKTEAKVYLNLAGVEDQALCRAMIGETAVNNVVRPYHLALCLDILHSAASRGTSLRPEDFLQRSDTEALETLLINRLLKYVDPSLEDAVVALSACRVFDRTLFRVLGSALGLETTDSIFGALTSLSFVWRIERSDSAYRIHDHLRMLLRQNKRRIQAHAVLFQYYDALRRAGNEKLIAEIIYHYSYLDPGAAMEIWRNLAMSAARADDLGTWNTLRSIAKDMYVRDDTDAGYLWISQGDYFMHLERYQEALNSYKSALHSYRRWRKGSAKPHAFCDLGMALTCIAQALLAIKQNSRAFRFVNHALNVFEHVDYSSHGCSGAAHQGEAFTLLATIHLDADRVENSLFCCRRAKDSYTCVQNWQSDVTCQIGLANALHIEAASLEEKLDYKEAAQSYQRAADYLETVIRLRPQGPKLHSKAAFLHSRIGALFQRECNLERASEHYGIAIGQFDEVAKVGALDHDHRIGKVLALVALIENASIKGDTARLRGLQRALLECLDQFPQRMIPSEFQRARLIALLKEAKSVAKEGDRDKAIKACNVAEAVIEELDPAAAWRDETCAAAHSELAALHTILNEWDKAVHNCLAANRFLDAVAFREGETLGIRAKRTEVLFQLAVIQRNQGIDAFGTLNEGTALLESIYASVGSDRQVQINAVRNLLNVAGMFAECGASEEAERTFLSAVEKLGVLFDDGWEESDIEQVCLIATKVAHCCGSRTSTAMKVLRFAVGIPQDPSTTALSRGPTISRAFALVILGEAELEKAEYVEAEQDLMVGYKLFDSLIRTEDIDCNLINVLARTSQYLGRLYSETDKAEAAYTAFQKSVTICDSALQSFPGNKQVLLEKAVALRRLAEMDMEHDATNEAAKKLAQCVEMCDELDDTADGLNCLGISFLRLGDIAVASGKPKDAINSCREAVKAFEKALHYKTFDRDTLVLNTGNALVTQARAEIALNRTQADETLRRAIEMHRKAIELAGPYAMAQFALVSSLHLLAQYLANVGDQHAAGIYVEASSACDKLIQISPGFLRAYSTRAVLEKSLAALQNNAGEPLAAIASLERSIGSCDQLIRIAPKDAQAYKLKISLLIQLGSLYRSTGQLECALNAYCSAMDAYAFWVGSDSLAKGELDLPVMALFFLAALDVEAGGAVRALDRALRALEPYGMINLIAERLLNAKNIDERSDSVVRQGIFHLAHALLNSLTNAGEDNRDLVDALVSFLRTEA